MPTKIELSKKIVVLIDAIREIQRLIDDIPSGVDYEADPLDDSPESMDSQIAGLIWKKCQEALGEVDV